MAQKKDGRRNQPEGIKYAAIRILLYDDGLGIAGQKRYATYWGKDHSLCIWLAIRDGYSKKVLSSNKTEHGFIDINNQFVSKERAKEIAIEYGQVPANFNKKLTSEDMW